MHFPTISLNIEFNAETGSWSRRSWLPLYIFQQGFHHWDPLTWIGVGETSLIFEIFLIIHLHAIQMGYKEQISGSYHN